jgi:hypothetical protein
MDLLSRAATHKVTTSGSLTGLSGRSSVAPGSFAESDEKNSIIDFDLSLLATTNPDVGMWCSILKAYADR